MNSKALPVIAAVFCIAQAAIAEPPPENETLSVGEIGKKIVEFATQAQSNGFSGAVLAAKDGRVIAAVGVGHADLEKKIANSPATLFEIASVTKQFTAAAIMRLVQDGKLKLDDSIATHLPGVPDDCKAITIDHLLRHTSGIPGSNAQGGGDDLAAVLPSFLRGGPKHPPGTHWEYWNQGYALLSEIIARASGMSYTEYCKQMLFEPAGLNSARFTGDEAPNGASVAIGQSRQGPPRSALEHPYGGYGFQYRGMGGAVMSVWDMWRWDRALRDDNLLNEASKSQLFKPGLNDYALGWFVRKDKAGRIVQSHGGGVRGFVCEVRRYPEQDALLVVMRNHDGAPLRDIAQSLEAILFEENAAHPLKASPDELANALFGRYRDKKGNLLTIEAAQKDGLLLAKIHWSPPSGPVTNAVIGMNQDQEVVLNDGSDLIVLSVERVGSEPATSITILGSAYRRVE